MCVCVCVQVSLQELLEAAGVESLDVAADSVNARDRSFRERGLILRVTVTYNNWRKSWFGTGYVRVYVCRDVVMMLSVLDTCDCVCCVLCVCVQCVFKCLVCGLCSVCMSLCVCVCV